MDIFTKDGRWFAIHITGDVPLALEEGNRAGFWRRNPAVPNEFDTVISTATGFTTYASKHFIKRFLFENNRMETADLEPSYNMFAAGVPGYWERLGGSFSASSDTLTTAAIRLTNAFDGDSFAEEARAFFDFRRKCLADAMCKPRYNEAPTLGPRQEREIQIYSEMMQYLFGGEIKAIAKFSESGLGRTLIRLARARSGSVPDIKLPSNSSQLGHIFRNAEGHFEVDTPQARSEIMQTVDGQYYTGQNYAGNSVYFRINENGEQVWVYTRNGVIQDAGRNAPGAFGKLVNGRVVR